MPDFMYNEIVTAQNLNGVAIDLGKSDFSVFTDNTPYAVEKLNAITQSLVGRGISSALNKFKITISAGSVVVGTGVAFFESGKKLKLTMPVTLSFSAGELYLHENISTGAVNIEIGELPTDNYIHLATINADKTFVDRRVVAKAKVELPSEGNSYGFTHLIPTDTKILDYNGFTFDIPIEGISKIFIKAHNRSFYIYDVNTSSFTGYDGRDSATSVIQYVTNMNEVNLYLYSGSVYRTVKLQFDKQDNKTVTFKYITDCYNVSSGNGNVKIEYSVFGGVEK